jgi:hypothetical protein
MGSNTGACFGIITELRALLERLATVDLTVMSDAALLAGLRELRPAMCQAQAVEHRLVGAVHARGATRVEGAVSTAARLRNRLHVADATVLVRSAAALDR